MNKSWNQADPARVVWLDLLRAFSAFLIVFLHISSHYAEDLLPLGSATWWTTDFYLALTRCAVPVFVMISGVFFLNPAKEISIQKCFTKYIWHILTVLLGWALLRTGVLSIALEHTPASQWGSAYFMSVITYWFLPMIIGLYLLTPVLRALTATRNKPLLGYFTGLCFVLGLCLPLAQGLQPKLFPQVVSLDTLATLLKLPLPIFCAHFVFGYYAYTYELKPVTKALIYIGAVVSLLLMAAGTYAFYGERGSVFYRYATYGSCVTPMAFLTGAAVFIACKDFLGKIVFVPRAVLWIERFSYCSLGVYILHLILVQAAVHRGLFAKLNVWPALTVPLYAVGLFLLCSGLIALLRPVSFLRKYFL